MNCLIFVFFSALVAICYASTTSYSFTSLTKLDYIAKHPPAAMIKTGGRLSERQINSLAANQYASIVSLFNFTTNDTTYQNVVDSFPSSTYEVALAESLDILISLPKPIYVHCHVGWTAALFTLLHLYRVGELPGSEFYNQGVALGYNYQSNPDAVALIRLVTGVEVPVTGPSLELPLTNNETSYKQYYWTHRAGNDLWYNAGQLLENHVASIKMQGYHVVVSFRANGEPTTRLPGDPTTGPVANLEFSDDQGNYSVEMERKAFVAEGLTFYNLPVTGTESWSVDTFFKYLPTLQEISKLSVPTITHCASGYRSAGYLIAYLAYSNNQCTNWALTEARRIGFAFAESASDLAVLQFFQALLKC